MTSSTGLAGRNASDADWAAIDAQIRKQGFLAPSIEKIRRHFREVMDDWFGLAERLNTLGQAQYMDCSDLLPGKPLLHPVSLGLQMMPRCLSSFQGSIILAERGLGIEAQVLVRNVYETAFWLGYLTADPTNAVPQLRQETLASEIGLFVASQRHLQGLDAATRRRVKEQLEEMRETCSSLPKPPKVEKLASLAGWPRAYFFYKELSGAAAHVSLKSLHSYLRQDEDGDVVGHQVGPDEENVGKSVWLGCRAIILAIDAAQRLTERNSRADELSSLNSEMEALEPYRFNRVTTTEG